MDELIWRIVPRLSLAELRARPLPVVLAFVAVAAAVALTVVTLAVSDASGVAYERLVDDSDAAHVWVFNDSPSLPGQLRALDGVAEVSGPIPRAQGSLNLSGTTLPIWLWAVPATSPSPAPTILTVGRWPDTTNAEAVIDRGLASRLDIGLGGTVNLSGPGGTIDVQVVGIGISTTGAPYPLDRPAELFTTAKVVSTVSGGQQAAVAIGVRLRDPQSAATFFRTASTATSTQLGGVTWLQIRDSAANASRPTEILLQAFAVFAFLAAGFVVANTVSAALLGKRRQLGLLMAAGMTPGQVVLMVIVQYVVVALTAGLAGVIAGWQLAPFFAGRVSSLLQAPRPPFDPERAALVIAGAVIAVVLFVAGPAAQVTRGTVGDALRGGRSRPPRRAPLLASLAGLLRLPVSVRLGAKDAFVHPMRAAMTIGAVGLVTATIVLSLIVETTGRVIADDPRIIGQPPYQLRLTPRQRNRVDLDKEAATIESTPGIAATMVERQFQARALIAPPAIEGSARPPALVPTQPFQVVALTGDISGMPFNFVEGRMAKDESEAVVGLGLVREFGVILGQKLQVQSGAATQTFTISGIVPSGDEDGRVLFVRGSGGGRGSIVVRTKAGQKTGAVGLAIEKSAPGRYTIDDLAAVFQTDLADQRDSLRSIVIALDSALLLVALANLAGVLVLTVRERTRELGILRAIGVTNGGVFASVGVCATIYTVVGVAIGGPAGYFITNGLFDHYGAEAGWPEGIAQMPPSSWFAIGGLAAIALIAAFVAVPARLAVRLTIREALAEQ